MNKAKLTATNITNEVVMSDLTSSSKKSYWEDQH